LSASANPGDAKTASSCTLKVFDMFSLHNCILFCTQRSMDKAWQYSKKKFFRAKLLTVNKWLFSLYVWSILMRGSRPYIFSQSVVGFLLFFGTYHRLCGRKKKSATKLAW
jgi:hypothetical protein